MKATMLLRWDYQRTLPVRPVRSLFHFHLRASPARPPPIPAASAVNPRRCTHIGLLILSRYYASQVVRDLVHG